MVIQSFVGCIAKLMKSSARARSVCGCSIRRTDWYYKGNITIITFTGIFNWKSLVKAMRAFRGVSVALSKRFLLTGLKTFEQIEQYLDTVCLHPTGRHWVNNFLHTLKKEKSWPSTSSVCEPFAACVKGSSAG